jgi:hypothetical protein
VGGGWDKNIISQEPGDHPAISADNSGPVTYWEMAVKWDYHYCHIDIVVVVAVAVDVVDVVVDVVDVVVDVDVVVVVVVLWHNTGQDGVLCPSHKVVDHLQQLLFGPDCFDLGMAAPFLQHDM